MPRFHDQFGKEYDIDDLNMVTWRVSVYAIIRNGRNEILVVKSGWDDRWELPGGGVEIGESLSEALTREILEETGYTVKRVHERPTAVGEQWFVTDDKKPRHALCLFFNVEIADVPRMTNLVNTADGPEEVIAMEWKPIEDLTDKTAHHVIHPALKAMR